MATIAWTLWILWLRSDKVVNNAALPLQSATAKNSCFPLAPEARCSLTRYHTLSLRSAQVVDRALFLLRSQCCTTIAMDAGIPDFENDSGILKSKFGIPETTRSESEIPTYSIHNLGIPVYLTSKPRIPACQHQKLGITACLRQKLGLLLFQNCSLVIPVRPH